MDVVDLTTVSDNPPKVISSASNPIVLDSKTNPSPSFAYSAAGSYNAPGVIPFAFIRTVISFSLINLNEFTARADSGPVSKEVISILRMVEGATFNKEKKRFEFPIESHEPLAGALISKQVHVNRLPQAALVARHTQSKQSKNSKISMGARCSSSSVPRADSQTSYIPRVKSVDPSRSFWEQEYEKLQV